MMGGLKVLIYKVRSDVVEKGVCDGLVYWGSEL